MGRSIGGERGRGGNGKRKRDKEVVLDRSFKEKLEDTFLFAVYHVYLAGEM